MPRSSFIDPSARPNKWLSKFLVLSVSISLISQLCSCGTLLYPERRGQMGSHIDPAVAIMDGLGLLLFIIPGVAAFAVDFSTGAIYLPHGRTSHLSRKELDSAMLDKKLDVKNFSKIIGQKLDRKIDLTITGTRVEQYSSIKTLLPAMEVASNSQGMAVAQFVQIGDISGS